MNTLLRNYIRESIRSILRDIREMSTVSGGAIAGVTTPLGTGPDYPAKSKKKKKKSRK